MLEFLNEYVEKFLGKTSVVAKDTPAFIGNRIGIFSIMSLFHMVKEMDLTVEEVDKLTGPVIGRPKSATFRTVDVVGLDTLVHVANGLYEGVPNDERHDLFKLPDFIQTMMDNKWLGSKTGQGFYKKEKKEDKTNHLRQYYKIFPVSAWGDQAQNEETYYIPKNKIEKCKVSCYCHPDKGE